MREDISTWPIDRQTANSPHSECDCDIDIIPPTKNIFTPPTVLSPNALLTQKINTDIELFPDLSNKDMYKAQWKHVQVLAGQFWKQWRSQYCNNL